MEERFIEIAGLRVIAVGDEATARVVVVLQHGYLMEPGDLSPFAKSIGVPAWFLFPEAPLLAEPRGRTWWAIDPVLREEALARGPRDLAAYHPEGLPAARARFLEFLGALSPRVGDRPLVLAGFSQGGMLLCDTLLREGLRPSLLALLSSSRLAFDEWQPLLGRVAGLRVLVSHGRRDHDLAFSTGEALAACLREGGADVTFVPHDGDHEIPLAVWRTLRKMILSLLPA